MAKIVKLTKDNVQIYPQTITQAIADTTRNKLLTTILTDIENSVTAETANRIAAIQALDLATVSGTSKYIKSITQVDGQVSATLGQVAASEVSNSGASGSAISADTTVQAALDTLAAKAAAQELVAADKSIVIGSAEGKTTVKVNIKSGEGVLKLDANNGLYTDLDLVKITESLPATVKERYQLLDSDNNQIGADIDIPKDSHIVSITYITDSGDTHYQNLEYVYIDASGATKTEYVDISSLVLEAEVGNGLQVNNHVISVKKDADSEAFLSVSADGVKISGVQNAINAAVEALDATESGETTYINVQVTEADGVVTGVAVTDKKAVIATSGSMESLAETGHLADAKAIKDYVDAKTGALDSNVSGQTADGFIKVEVDQQNGALNYVKVTGTTQNMSTADASHKGLAEAYDVKTYVDGEIGKLDATVSGQSGAVKVQVTEADGKLTGVAVTATTASIQSTVSDANALATAKDVKDYVDSAITKTAIVDSADIDATSAATGTTLAINYQQVVSGGTKAVKSGDIFAWGVTAEDVATVSSGFTWPNA